ncbi:MAG: hypothetical protein FWH06_03750 [Oscillospiraceae bacterium]|nr:hypothetical protein [Oscillospiraceae bacterium]
MSINAGGVGGVTGYNSYAASGKPTPKERVAPEYAADKATFEKLWADSEKASQALRDMVEKLLGTQSGDGQAFWAIRANPGAYNIEVDPETAAKAEEMIGEDGFYGVAKTTDRIIEFARALAGDSADEKTIENMRSGAQKGFDKVARIFGGWDKLPEVTKQTYDAVMKAFDDWKAEAA